MSVRSPSVVLVAALSAAAPVAAFEIGARWDLPAVQYGRLGATAVDLRGDGTVELVYQVDHLAETGTSTGLAVIDPRDGFRIVDALTFGDDAVLGLSPIPNGSAPARRFVTISRDGYVTLWRGLPLRPYARGRTSFFVDTPFRVRAGNLDADADDEVVFCSGATLRTFDLADARSRTLSNLPCADLELVQADADPEREVLFLPDRGVPSPALVLDATTGATLLTAPQAAGPDLGVGNIDGTGTSELATWPDQLPVARPGVSVATFSPGWSVSFATSSGPAPASGTFLSLVDLDADGRDDTIAAAPGFGQLTLWSAFNGTPQGVVGPDVFVCEQATFADLAPGPGVEVACANGGIFNTDLPLSVVNVATNQILWQADNSLVQPTPPVLGDVDGDGDVEVVTSVHGRAAGDTGVILVLDGTTLAESARTTLPPGAAVPSTSPLSVAIVGAAGEPARADFVVAAQEPVLHRLRQGQPAPLWSRSVPQVQRVLGVVANQALPLSGEYLAYALADQAGSCRVAGVRVADGALLWTSEAFGAVDALGQPTITLTRESPPRVLAACGSGIAAFDGADGRLLWQRAPVATDLDVVQRSGQQYLLVTEATAVTRRDLASGDVVATLPVLLRSVVDLGGDGSVVGRHGDALTRQYPVTGETIESRRIGSGTRLGLVAGASGGDGSIDVYANTEAGIVRVRTRAETPIELNQLGLSGTWFEPSSAGQGLVLEFLPDLTEPGRGLVAGAWFAFDSNAPGGADRQRWFSLTGTLDDGDGTSTITISRNVGGRFDQPWVNELQVVGSGRLTFSDCSHGRLLYSLDEDSGTLVGEIEITRLTANVNCTPDGGTTPNADAGLSGNWYEPATSGQGFLIEVNPVSGVVFVAWFTYDPNGHLPGGPSGQRWFTAQTTYVAGARQFTMPVYETRGGIFDVPTAAEQVTTAVGTLTLSFEDCTNATIDYTFNGGSSTGRSGNIPLDRIGPAPAGCTR